MNDPLLTLCAATAAGVVLLTLASRLGIPAIVFWLLGGVLIGPEGLNFFGPEALGRGMKIVVGLSVAVILFEGGLTLDIRVAQRSLAVIWRILSIGVLVTWVGAAAVIYLLFRPPLSIAILGGSLLIVTGPTVVAPILRRIHVRDRIKNILYWESVLGDAIGVFMAVLVFEWISPDLSHGTWSPLVRFATRVGVGVGFGVVAGFGLIRLLRSSLVRDEHANIVVLALALLTYAGAEAVLHEAGVLAAIVAGFCVALRRPPQLAKIKRFKLELTELCVGTLFVLLAGTLRLENFQALGWELALAVALLCLVVRPASMLISTRGQGFSLQEIAFLSWVAPRGIVAAFLASLFSLKLLDAGALVQDAQLIHTFTFAVIGATVILQGTTAPMVAKLLGLEKEPRKTWLIVGDSTVVETLASALREAGIPALGLLRSEEEERENAAKGAMLLGDPLNTELLDDPRFGDVVAVLSISPNIYYNELVCERWARVVGQQNCYHWSDTSNRIEGRHRFVGSPVLAEVGTPSAITAQLEAGLLAIEAVGLGEKNIKSLFNHSQPIFQGGKKGGKVATPEGMSWAAGDVAVVARPRVKGLAGLVRGATVVAQSDCQLAVVLRAILTKAAETNSSLPTDELLASILDREGSMSTAMGAGVMIPHAYHSAVQQTECYVASIAGGVCGATPDGEPVRLVFLVISPSGDAKSHLGALAAIAGLCSDHSYLELLEKESDSDALLQLVKARE